MRKKNFISIRETKEFKEELERFIENTTLEKFLKESHRGFGKTELRSYILLRLLEKEE